MIDDIRYLLVFARIVETGSVSGAAAALQLSAATVSSHLSKLELSMGTALLYRNTRKLSLTPAGAKLYTSAQAMQQLYAQPAHPPHRFPYPLERFYSPAPTGAD